MFYLSEKLNTVKYCIMRENINQISIILVDFLNYGKLPYIFKIGGKFEFELNPYFYAFFWCKNDSYVWPRTFTGWHCWGREKL